jgi:ParB-like chromosome segregation protein Spo0J
VDIEKKELLYQRLDCLERSPRNPRTHSKHQIRQIAESIRVFGFTNPVLIDGKNRIIAGHGRVEAAKLLGMTEVPTIRLEQLTEAQIRAYVIADNKLAENAGWDRETLAIELQYLMTFDCADFDVTIT